MHTAAAKNNMLNAIGITHLSLHSAYSASGANELAGGSPAYARKAVTLAAASGGSRSASTQPVFDVAAGSTVRFVGKWDALSGGNFLGMAPNGGSEKEYSVDVTADRIRCPAHGYSANQKIVFYQGTVPGGLVEGTVYFVVSPTTDDFQVAATSGGAAINLTALSTDDSLVSAIVEESFGAQGTHTISAFTTNLNG